MRSNRNTGPEARLPKGFEDTTADDLRVTARMLGTIREVYERYGFEPLETPAIEYTDALGKFLPDQDRPNAGVFSFQDEDQQWLSLRYDLTAPLARYVAENFERLPKPFRRYQVGPVWRNEKPGPGRFRQFMQFDADTVGTDNVAADAEICMLAADTLEALGIERGDYVIRVSSRKLLDGLKEAVPELATASPQQWLTTLRALDKLDRLKREGVKELLGSGRRDESGDYTKGAGLSDSTIAILLDFVSPSTTATGSVTMSVEPARLVFSGQPITMSVGPLASESFEKLRELRKDFPEHSLYQGALNELQQMISLWSSSEYDGRIVFDPTVVRGLEYYTGPVFEAEITTQVKNEDGQTVRFGSVGGGGRYDGLVERFLGTKVPATGFSIGVSRLQAALAALGRTGAQAGAGPVVVLVMEKDRLADYQRMAQRLRNPDDGGPPIRAEMYLGAAGMKAQMKYADKRGAPCVVIQGGDERDSPGGPMVQIKDLIEGAKAAATIKDSKEWREGRPAQVSVPEASLVAAVREVLARHKG
jgi:histidyl-tRNA synthetase